MQSGASLSLADFFLNRRNPKIAIGLKGTESSRQEAKKHSSKELTLRTLAAYLRYFCYTHRKKIVTSLEHLNARH